MFGIRVRIPINRRGWKFIRPVLLTRNMMYILDQITFQRQTSLVGSRTLFYSNTRIQFVVAFWHVGRHCGRLKSNWIRRRRTSVATWETLLNSMQTSIAPSLWWIYIFLIWYNRVNDISDMTFTARVRIYIWLGPQLEEEKKLECVPG